jgi:hypothetical protein
MFFLGSLLPCEGGLNLAGFSSTIGLLPLGGELEA